MQSLNWKKLPSKPYLLERNLFFFCSRKQRVMTKTIGFDCEIESADELIVELPFFKHYTEGFYNFMTPVPHDVLNNLLLLLPYPDPVRFAFLVLFLF